MELLFDKYYRNGEIVKVGPGGGNVTSYSEAL